MTNNDQRAAELIKVVDRIRKLLAMARDKSSPHESAIAMQRARSLMDAHQLTEADVSPDGDELVVVIDSVIVEKYKYMPVWKTGLISAVARFNDCYAVRHNESDSSFAVIVHGFKDDVELTCMMYTNIVDAIVDACAEDQANRGFTRYNASIGDEFKRGYTMAVIHKLTESSEVRRKSFVSSNGNSLVLSKDLSVINGLKAKGIEFTSSRSISMRPTDESKEVYWKGYVQGSQHKIMEEVELKPHECPLDSSCSDQGCHYHYADPETLPDNQEYVNRGYQNRAVYLSIVASAHNVTPEYTVNLSDQLGYSQDFSGLLTVLKESA